MDNVIVSNNKTPVFVGNWGVISVELHPEPFNVGTLNETNTIFLHCEQIHWSRGVYEEMLDVFSILLSDIKELGYKYVASIVPKCQCKTNKFQTMFGLELYAEVNSLNNLYKMEI